MNLNLTWKELAEAVRGSLAREGKGAFIRLSTDSRKLAAGETFWALKGPNYDPHDFIPQALEKGAGALVVERLPGIALPDSVAVIKVVDSTRALQDLAGFWRKKFSIPMAAITGSNGKTTTKEILKSIARTRGPVCANPGNLNNHIGLPLSLLELSPEHLFGIFELGASRPGDIELLTRLVSPKVGILTNIAPAHLEFFGSIENVFKTKSELIENMDKDSIVVLNADDPYLSRWIEPLGRRAVTFGFSPSARVRILKEGSDWFLQEGDQKAALDPEQYQGVNSSNAAAAAAAALVLGFSWKEIEEGLRSFAPVPLRFEKRTHSSGAVFIVDAYNANPASMKASLETLCESYPDRRKFAVLGDMKELGGESGDFHRRLGELLASLPLSGIFLAGEEMEAAYKALVQAKATVGALCYEKKPELLEPAIRGHLKPASAFLFKASRVLQLEKLAEKL